MIGNNLMHSLCVARDLANDLAKVELVRLHIQEIRDRDTRGAHEESLVMIDMHLNNLVGDWPTMIADTLGELVRVLCPPTAPTEPTP